MLEKFSHAYLHFGIPKAKAGEAACRVKELILSRDSYRVYPDAAAVLAVCLYTVSYTHLLQLYRGGIPFIGRDGVSITLVGMDKVP